MRSRLIPIEAPANAIDVCGTGGDHQNTFNISTTVALVLAAAAVWLQPVLLTALAIGYWLSALDVRYRDGMARFEDQIVISGNVVSAGGDSGSLDVTKGVLLADRRPVALHFAGSPTSTGCWARPTSSWSPAT